MKKLTILLLCLTASGAYAQETSPAPAGTDSISVRELDEFVVEGRTQRVIKYGVEYTPKKNVKKLAMDAVHLLSMMQIPQLNAPPGSSSVTTLTGAPYSMFIDYVPASETDITALRAVDVLRVEVLDYPQDPRFNSAQHVVNFIMVRYEWGGYTKLNAGGEGPDNPSVRGGVYSKFVHKKWTFDVNGGGSGRWENHIRANSTATFRDIWYNATRYDEIKRESASGDGYNSRSNGEWTSLRAAYQKENIYLQHTLTFNRSANPYSRDIGDVSFSPEIIASTRSLSESNSQSISPGINAYYQFILPKGNSIVASWNLSYGRNRSHNMYRLLGLDPILKDNLEDVYTPNANVSYSKNLGHNNTFRTSLMTYNSIYDTRYEGSYVDRQKMLSSENMLFLEYMQNWGFGLSLYSRVGVSYVVGRLDGVNKLQQWNPRLGFQLEYQINDRHSASLAGWWGNSHPSPSTANDAMIQTNELEWSMGNPDLRNTLFQTLEASYNFIPTNIFALSATLRYEGNPSRQAMEFFVLPGYDGLVHRVVNSGNAHDYQAMVSASLRLLDNSLGIRATGWAERSELTGLDGRSINAFGVSSSISYIRSHWSMMVYYHSPGKDMGPWSYGVRSFTPQRYGIMASCAFGGFQARLSFTNWFRRDGYSTSVFDSPLYSSKSISLDNGVSRRISLTLSYTFSYGKKVNRNNELKEAEGVGSAILQ